jgi:hypothetical protein
VGWRRHEDQQHLGQQIGSRHIGNGNDCASIWAPGAYCDAGGARRGDQEKLSNSAGRSTGHVTIDTFNDPFQYSRGAISILQGNFKGAHMIKLTETREITPYLWVHPDEGAVMAGSKKRPQSGVEAFSVPGRPGTSHKSSKRGLFPAFRTSGHSRPRPC